MHGSGTFGWFRAAVRVLAPCLLGLGSMVDAGELSTPSDGARVELLLPGLDGTTHDLRALEGRVVLVNFWASWCTPCVEEMPGIQRLADAMRGRPFAVIGVNVGEGELRARAAARRLGVRFPVVLDWDSRVFNRWGATVLPTTYVLDKQGIVRHVGRGTLEWDGPGIVELLGGLMESGKPSATAAGLKASAPE